MFVYHCDKCKAFESFVEADEDWKCKECGNDLMPLGVTIDEWNALSEENMMKTINFAREEAERKKRKFDVPEAMEDPNKYMPDVRINLMECPKCLKQISPNSSSCPYCQYYFVNNPNAVKIRRSNRKAGISLIASAMVLILIFVLYSIFVSGKFIVELVKEAMTGQYTALDWLKSFGIYALLILAVVFIVIGIKKLLKSRTPKSEEIFVEDIEFVSEVIHASDIKYEEAEQPKEAKEIKVSEKIIGAKMDPVTGAYVRDELAEDDEKDEKMERDNYDMSSEDVQIEEVDKNSPIKIKNIFYDLDGTLLPMDMDVFIKDYFGRLCKKMAPYGYDPEKLPDAVWAGTKAMVMNDGVKNNEEVFWDFFTKHVNVSEEDKALFDDFYANDFDEVKAVCGYNEKVPALIEAVKKMGFNQVLATNPLFPKIATRKRIAWAGLKEEDFITFTHYSNSHYCKPNPQYYQELLDRLDMKAEETLMIGNDVDEDMVAGTIGMKVFLVTDCMINKSNQSIDEYPHGDFDAALEYIKSL